MRKAFLILLSLIMLALPLSIVPAEPIENKKEFVAVFTFPGTHKFWRKYNPDLYFVASDWDDFDVFLKEIKERSGHKPVVIDLDVHGADGWLYLQYGSGYGEPLTYQASLGYVCNEIDKYLPPKRVIFLLEACHPEVVYKNLHNPIFIHDGGDLVEPYKSNTAPPYAIWAVGRTFNFGNLIFLERKYNVYAGFMDMRLFEDRPVEIQDNNLNSAENVTLYGVWKMLLTFGA